MLQVMKGMIRWMNYSRLKYPKESEMKLFVGIVNMLYPEMEKGAVGVNTASLFPDG